MSIKQKYFRVLKELPFYKIFLNIHLRDYTRVLCSNAFSHLCPNITGINSKRYISQSKTILKVKNLASVIFYYFSGKKSMDLIKIVKIVD